MPYRGLALRARLTVNTSAVANTNVTTAVIAAPGAGFALRIVYIKVGGVSLQTGIIRAEFQDTTGAVSIADTSIAPGGSDAYAPPEPGTQLANNVGLNVQHAASVATQNVRVVVSYYIDRIA